MNRLGAMALLASLLSGCQCGEDEVMLLSGATQQSDAGRLDAGSTSHAASDAGSFCSKNADCEVGYTCRANGEFGGQCERDATFDAGVVTVPPDAGVVTVPPDAGTAPCVHTTCGSAQCGVVTDACGGTIDCGACASCAAVAAGYHAYRSPIELTDPQQCSNCPGAFSGFSALSSPLPSNATTVALEGTAPNANSCCWEVEGPSGGLSSGSVVPNGGQVSARLPVFCGTNLVRLICSNDAGRRVMVREVEAPCPPRDLRVTLAWDTKGRDMELHLVKDNGRINTDADCTWYTCVNKTPTWSTEPASNPHKDVDNVVTLGPENIYLQTAESVTYKVLVEYWGSGTESTADITVTLRERSVATISRALQVHEVWYVGNVTFPSGALTKIDTVTPCSANWRATTPGCDMALPSP